MGPSPSRRIISGKWVWKNKLDEVGQVLKNKSRWVARGFTQIFGLNYTDTFAPTPSQTVIKILLAHAAQHFLLVYQYDFKTAFLNSLIGDDEEIYVEQPHGFEVTEVNGKKGKYVCKLKKGLYGLKQSPR